MAASFRRRMPGNDCAPFALDCCHLLKLGRMSLMARDERWATAKNRRATTTHFGTRRMVPQSDRSVQDPIGECASRLLDDAQRLASRYTAPQYTRRLAGTARPDGAIGVQAQGHYF